MTYDLLQVVVLPGNRTIPYDFLVLSTGLQDNSAPSLGRIDYKVSDTS